MPAVVLAKLREPVRRWAPASAEHQKASRPVSWCLSPLGAGFAEKQARTEEKSNMVRKLDRGATVLVAAMVGLMAIVPGWQIMTDSSVYGFKLPASWLSAAWPFSGYFVAGLVLLVVIGGGCLLTAGIAAFNEEAGAIAALLMGFVLVGWIGGELIFMTQTMIMTWVILASGVALIALGAPYAVPRLFAVVRRPGRQGAQPSPTA